MINFIKTNRNKMVQHNIVLRLNNRSKITPVTDDGKKFNIITFPHSQKAQLFELSGFTEWRIREVTSAAANCKILFVKYLN